MAVTRPAPPPSRSFCAHIDIYAIAVSLYVLCRPIIHAPWEVAWLTVLSHFGGRWITRKRRDQNETGKRLFIVFRTNGLLQPEESKLSWQPTALSHTFWDFSIPLRLSLLCLSYNVHENSKRKTSHSAWEPTSCKILIVLFLSFGPEK